MGKIIHELTGKKFGRWTVISFSHKRGYERFWNCVCECGTKRLHRTSNLMYGKTLSCGCLLMETMWKAKTLEESFWNRVEKTDGCWIWHGHRSARYGQITINGRHMNAHRAAWILTHGPIDDEKLFVLHSCDNGFCVNPTHLRLGTHQDNMDDKIKRNRQVKGKDFWSTKLTKKQVETIRRDYAQKKYTQVELSEKYGVWQPTISSIVRHKIWRNP